MLSLLPAMPAIPSLVTKVVANDRLLRLKEISLRIQSLPAIYYFRNNYSEWCIGGMAASVVFGSWWHRQYEPDWAWQSYFSDYIKEHVI